MYCPHCGKSILDESSFCSFCAKPVTAPPITTPPTTAKQTSTLDSALRIIGALAVIIIGLVILGVYFNSHSTVAPNRSSSPATNAIAAITHQPVTHSIFAGQMVVAARQFRFWTITITPQMTNAQLMGSFHTAGGTGNDIQAVITNPDEFENWKNGHHAQVYYGTQRTTNGNFNVRLAPGTYILAFSNAFSLLAPKEITAEINLQYIP